MLVGGICPQHGEGDSACYTMPQLLKALGRDVIDYWSVDAGQDTLGLLMNTDFTQAEVGLLTVKVPVPRHDDQELFSEGIRHHMEKIFVDGIRDYMEQSGFSRVASRAGIDFFVNPCYIAKRRLPWPTREFPRCPKHDSCGADVTVSIPGIEQGVQGVSDTPTFDKVLVISFTTGTSNELAFLSNELGMATNIGPLCAERWATAPSPCDPVAFTDDRVSAIWENTKLSARLRSYRAIFVASNIWASHTFLGRKELGHKPIFIWLGLLRAGFDEMISGITAEERDRYITALRNASCFEKHVYFIAANEAQMEYAKGAGNLNSSCWPIIRPIGRESEWLQRKSNVKKITGPPFQSPQLCTSSASASSMAKSSITAANVTEVVSYETQGRARGISVICRGLLIVPDVPSSLELWENAQMGNVMFVPSVAFLIKLKNISQNPVFDTYPLTRDFLINKTDWYRPEQRPLFVYFDSLEDLAFRFQSTDYAKKRQEMRKFMDKHEAIQLAKWRELFGQESFDSARASQGVESNRVHHAKMETVGHEDETGAEPDVVGLSQLDFILGRKAS